MARRLTEGRLVLATHNPGKLVEIADLMRPYGVAVASAGELGLPEPVEDGDSFEANALIKAHAAAKGSGLPALADDSGLVVPALDGRPGIHSARWAGPGKDFGLAMKKVEDELGGRADRGAYFVCVLALAWPPENGRPGHVEAFEGRVHGKLVWPLRGTRGFGYDPMFQADGYDITFGEMDPAAKHAISHRAQAFRQLVSACLEKP